MRRRRDAAASARPSGRRWGRARPRARRADHRAGLRDAVHRVATTAVATVRLRLPTFFCAPNFSWLMVADALRRGVRGARSHPGLRLPRGSLRLRGDQPRGRGPGRVRRRVPRRGPRGAGRPAGRVHPQGGTRRPGAVARPLVERRRHARAAGRPAARATSRRLRTSTGMREPPGRGRLAGRRRRPVPPAPRRRAGHRRPGPCTCAEPGSTRVSIEANGGTCRDLLAQRYAATS